MAGSLESRWRGEDMKFQFDIADRERIVEIQRQSDVYRIEVDGRSCLVDAVRVADDTWSLIVSDEAIGRVISAEAVVVPYNGNGSMSVYIDGLPISVSLRGGLGRRARGESHAHGAGPQRVTAPMPGKVVRVLVKSGDEVHPRQGLVVVEAMKMENELRATRAGRVRNVFVSEGQSVEAGTALVVVE
jgi:acetyl/propionyl-CoA carboxylase alpha subunit